MWQTTTIGTLLALFTANAAFGFACITTSGGQCIHWDPPAATITSFLGSPGAPLANGTATWDQNVMSVASDWNNTSTNFHFDVAVGGQFINPCGAQGPGHTCTNTGPVGNNPVFFADSVCGAGFGDVLELVNDCWVQSTGAILNAPVFVNSTVSWNAYDGPLQFPNGQVIYDIRRVLLHELGHVLGLDHPDAHGQTVTAIMNSRVSNLDRLQPDDISGIVSLYGGAPAGGSSPPSTGCQIEARPASPAAWLLLLPLCIVALALRRRASGRLDGAESGGAGTAASMVFPRGAYASPPCASIRHTPANHSSKSDSWASTASVMAASNTVP